MTISDIINRGDAEFAEWAIAHLEIDLAAEWTSLSDNQRDWLVDSGIVGETPPTIECTGAESWRSDWRTENGAAWPTYTLEISAHGMDPITVSGWHRVGILGRDRQSEEWCTDDDDGACDGLPRVDGWTILPGDNVGAAVDIPVWRNTAGEWVTLDRALMGRSDFACVAIDADHGGEPTWEDVDRDDMKTHSSVYVLRGNVVVEVDILAGGVAGVYREDDTIYYYATAWAHSLDDETYETEEDARDAIMELADDGKLYSKEKHALDALAHIALDAHDIPAGLTVEIDNDGLCITADDGDQDEQYHLDADDLRSVIVGGWSTVIPDIIGAFGRRATLDAARQWQADMDAIAASDPWVIVADSIDGGNCPAGTKQFIDQLAASIGANGELGAVRSSVILGLRDDRYTRRAVRIAASRMDERGRHGMALRTLGIGTSGEDAV